jgi:hypothetical protein
MWLIMTPPTKFQPPILSIKGYQLDSAILEFWPFCMEIEKAV